MQNSGQRLFRFALLILVFSMIGFVLSACGGDDKDSKDEATQQNTAANDDTVSGLAVGDMAPAFSLPSVDGGEVSLADYVGQQPVLLYFHMAVG